MWHHIRTEVWSLCCYTCSAAFIAESEIRNRHIYYCGYSHRNQRRWHSNAHWAYVSHAYVWHVSSIRVTWLIHTCDMTHPYVWHDSLTYRRCRQDLASRAYLFMRHATYINSTRRKFCQVTLHISVSRVVHVNEACHTYLWAMSHVYEACHTCLCHTYINLTLRHVTHIYVT